jgi:hypothetical protein
MLGRRGRAARPRWFRGAEARYASSRGGAQPPHARGDLVPRPTPHHRRKAGSGPPATALIAWIGTDPRRHSATAATAEGGHKHAPRSPASFRSARNVVASVALICGAVLAVTVSATKAVLAPRGATTPPAISQDHQAAPPVPAKQVDPHPMVSPLPAAAQPAPVRQAPQSIPVLPETEHDAQTATPVAVEQAAVEQAPAKQAPAKQAAVPRVRTQPDAVAQQRVRTKPDDTPTSSSTRAAHSSQRSPSAREARPGLGSTVNRATESLGSTLGLR